MSLSKPNLSLQDLLLASWRHDQEHSRDSHYPSPEPKVLCYSSGPAGLAARQDNQSKIRQQLLESCEQYVLNYLPTHLLRISDMALVTRAEFWDTERPRVERELQDYDLQNLTEVKQGSRPGSRKRARGDKIVETNRNAVRSHPMAFRMHFLLHFQVHPQPVQVRHFLAPLGRRRAPI